MAACAGQLDALASSFQVVCDIWHASIPGMLASTVSRDPDDENFVHDVRIFADGASYAAHVDKSNVELTKAMDSWFGNYDTSVPHTGALFTVGDGNTGKTQRLVPPGGPRNVRLEAPHQRTVGPQADRPRCRARSRTSR